jgi:hypothetical protein
LASAFELPVLGKIPFRTGENGGDFLSRSTATESLLEAFLGVIA